MKISVKQFLDNFVISLSSYIEIWDNNTREYVFKGECVDAYKIDTEYLGSRYKVCAVEGVADDAGFEYGICLDICLNK